MHYMGLGISLVTFGVVTTYDAWNPHIRFIAGKSSNSMGIFQPALELIFPPEGMLKA